MARDRANGPDAEARRLFVAVAVPDPAQHALDDLVEAHRDRWSKARWTPRANRHVTVRFLGPTWPRLVDDVTEATRTTAAASAPFDLSLAGCGRFPARGAARVLWVGLTDPAGGLPALAETLQGHLPASFEPETRPYRAHLTVARSDPPLEAGAWTEAAPGPVTWTVTELLLIESHLERPHARYEIRGRFPLGEIAATAPEPR